MSKEITKDKSLELSLQERLHLTLRKSSKLYKYLNTLATAVLLFLGFSMVSVWSFFRTIFDSGTVEPIEGCEPGPYFEICDKFTLNPGFDSNMIISTLYDTFVSLTFILGIIVVIAGAFAIWVVVSGRSLKKELEQMNFEYTNQAYFFTLSTSTHGKLDVAMDFFNAAENIFPELKQEEILSLEKSGEEMEVEGLELVDDEEKKKPKVEYDFDIVAKTKEGYFVVKYFTNEKVTSENLKEFIETAKDEIKSWTKGIFRLVCLAKAYDKKALEEYEELIDKEVPLDLILVHEKGFEFAKIGSEKF